MAITPNQLLVTTGVLTVPVTVSYFTTEPYEVPRKMFDGRFRSRFSIACFMWWQHRGGCYWVDAWGRHCWKVGSHQHAETVYPHGGWCGNCVTKLTDAANRGTYKLKDVNNP